MMFDVIAEDDQPIPLPVFLQGLRFLIFAMESNLAQGEVYPMHTCAGPIEGGVYEHQRHVHFHTDDPRMTRKALEASPLIKPNRKRGAH